MNTLFGDHLQQISRRQFLKLAAAGFSSFFLLPLLEHWPTSGPYQSTEPTPSQGRILNNHATLYDKPSFSGKTLKVLYFDLVLPITQITIGDAEPDYNRIWYEIDHSGFVHSGSVQPVEIHPQQPLKIIPEKGFLAEVCVPFAEALWSLRKRSLAYRLYYSTTHWVTGVTEDTTGKTWYHIKDDKWGYTYYVDARHLAPIPAADLAPIHPEVPFSQKRIQIDLSKQVLTAYEADKVVFMTRTATGARFSEGDFRTRTGHFITNRKRPSRHMAAGDRAAPNSYDLPGVPWISYLTLNGVAIHGTFWHNDFGHPRSHGCVNVSSLASRWIYRWSNPRVPLLTETFEDTDGTSVEVA